MVFLEDMIQRMYIAVIVQINIKNQNVQGSNIVKAIVDISNMRS